MDLKVYHIREWIMTISASITMISIAVGVWSTLAEYELKLRAEQRLAESARAETDIRLVKAFSELILTASGRSEYVLSETTIEKLFESGAISAVDLNDPEALNDKLQLAASFSQRIGMTTATAATTAIAALAQRHEVLRDSGIKALEREIIKENAPKAVERYLEELRALRGNTNANDN
jgi:ethanolamine ammonia-lyase small subunit